MKFRLKITLSMLCLLAALFSVGGSILISISFQNALEQEELSAGDRHRMLLSTLMVTEDAGVRRDARAVSQTLKRFSDSGAPAWSAIRFSSGSETLYRDGAASAQLRSFSEQADPAYTLLSYFKSEDGTPFLQISGSFTRGEELLYLDTAYDLTALYAARERQQQAYHKVLLGMLILCAVAVYSVSWMLTRPLNRLSRASRQIASGNLAYRSNIRTADEIGALAADFDSMAAQVEKSVSSLEDAMARQEQFMASFAHELKTPMTSIIGYADLLRGQSLTAEEEADAANYIFTEGKRLESLSLKLLDIFVSGRQGLKLTPVSPAHMVRNAAERLRCAYAGMGIRMHGSGEEGLCLLDADLVLSLLVNLLENARKALPKGGDIAIDVRLLPDGCRISVSDNGRGIPPEALTHLTQAFYRVDKARSRAQGGVGLGLALCEKIATLHGGALHFASKPGVGTRVTASLRRGRP